MAIGVFRGVHGRSCVGAVKPACVGAVETAGAGGGDGWGRQDEDEKAQRELRGRIGRLIRRGPACPPRITVPDIASIKAMTARPHWEAVGTAGPDGARNHGTVKGEVFMKFRSIKPTFCSAG